MTNSANSIKQDQPDAELLRLAREGNEDAFAALFNANKAKVYSLCLRMTANSAEAEDLTQDAFLQVFRKLGSFRGDSALSTWLHRVAVNTVLMHFRKKGVRQMSLDEPSTREPRSPNREYGALDGKLSNSVDRIVLTRAMNELPEGYRTIFLMHEVKGYDHREIADRLRCSVGNSKSQLHRAKAKMREIMAPKIMASCKEPEAPASEARTRKPRARYSAPGKASESLGIGQQLGSCVVEVSAQR